MTYEWSKTATDNYGLLADIIGADEYEDLTNIDTYGAPIKPLSYDPTINNAMPTHKWKRKEEDWKAIRQAWFIHKGFLQGMVDNLRDALNKQYYSQLRHCLTAYRNITPYQILEHLNDCWCPLDVQAKKELWRNYYTKWDTDEHLTAFGKCLNDNQLALVRLDVGISDKDKLQFYRKEIYNSNKFDKQDMLAWENYQSLDRNCDELPKKEVCKKIIEYAINEKRNYSNCE